MGKRDRKPPGNGDGGTKGALPEAPNFGGSVGGTETKQGDGHDDGANVVNLAAITTSRNDSNDSGDGSAGGSDGNERAKRKYTKRASKETVDLTALLSENLYSFHAFMAGVTGKPIWKIEQDEADQVGTAIQNVARHYDIPGVDQKTVDYIRLCRTLGMVYGGRIFAARMMAGSSAKAAPAKPEGPKPGPTPTPPNPPQNNTGPRLVRASPGPGLPDIEVWQ